MIGYWRGFYVIWLREMLRFRRERTRFVSAITVPILFLVLLGSGLREIVVSPAPGLEFADFIFPGVAIMSLFMTAFAAGMSVVWEREFGFLKEVLVAPVSRGGVALGKVLGSATIAFIQAVVLVSFAPLLGVSIHFEGALKALLLLFITAVAIAALGTFIGSRMRSMQGFHVLSELLLLPMIFLSGAFFPVDKVPAWLGIIARLNFVTYSADGIRQVMLPTASHSSASESVGYLGIMMFGNRVSLWADVAIVAGFALAMVGLASWSLARSGID